MKITQTLTPATYDFVCKSRACAPPPVGRGGSIKGGDPKRQRHGGTVDSLVGATEKSGFKTSQKALGIDVDFDNPAKRAKAWHAAGEQGKPKIKSDDELDAEIKVGGVELFRGVASVHGSAAKHIEEFRSGNNPRPADGINGFGFYSTPEQGTARRYSQETGDERKGTGQGNVVRMVLPKGSKVTTVDKLLEETSDYDEAHGIRRGVIDRMERVADVARAAKYDAVIDKNTTTGEPYYIIVNRAAILISAKNQ